MQNLDVNKAADAWSSLAGAVFVPHTDEEYRRLVAILDGLTDEVGEDESLISADALLKTSTWWKTRNCQENDGREYSGENKGADQREQWKQTSETARFE